MAIQHGGRCDKLLTALLAIGVYHASWVTEATKEAMLSMVYLDPMERDPKSASGCHRAVCSEHYPAMWI